MAVFWTTEVIPLPITAMFPAILFPAFGIMTSSQVRCIVHALKKICR